MRESSLANDNRTILMLPFADAKKGLDRLLGGEEAQILFVGSKEAAMMAMSYLSPSQQEQALSV